MLHHEVRAHHGEASVDAECCHRGVHGDCFDQLAEGAGTKRQRVATRKDYFPDVAVNVQPVAHLAGDIGDVLERVVLAETEAATGTAGGGRDNQGALVVFLDDAVGFSGW